MNADKEKTLIELSRRNPFWICLIVFTLLAADHGFGLVNRIQQRQQLEHTQLVQTQNMDALNQARQLEARLEGLSLELLQIAATNSTAKQIVQEFNIQWNPRPAAAAASNNEKR